MRKWSGKIRDVRGYCNDCFDDFCVTVEEVVQHKSLPQILGVIAIVTGFAVVTIVLWAVLSFLLALPVWWLWNAAMPDILKGNFAPKKKFAVYDSQEVGLRIIASFLGL